MEERSMIFRNGQKVEFVGFLLSDIMGIHAAIVNGVNRNYTYTKYRHYKIANILK